VAENCGLSKIGRKEDEKSFVAILVDKTYMLGVIKI
jgi:hypothetical protein